MKPKILMIVAVCLLAAVVLAAAWPTSKPRQNTGQPIEWSTEIPPRIAKLLDRGCRDCHSNDTKWPWYSRIPPASWLVAKDVENARAAMNLSDWPVSQPHRSAGALLASCADVQLGRMPLPGYQWMHPESRWDESEKSAFCEWAREESRRVLANGQPIKQKESQK